MSEIYSILNNKEDKAVCSFLAVGETNILLDCGWDLNCSKAAIQKLDDAIAKKRLDIVLLTNPNFESIGLLPYVLRKQNQARIFSTTPISKMGYYLILDRLTSIANTRPFDDYTEEDIYAAFNSIQEINYFSHVSLGSSKEIDINPIPNGGTLGGTIWRIKYLLREIVYAPLFSIESIK